MKVRHIKELRLKHFRAFEDTRLPIDDLTVLVGRNGSGKTTLIQAFDFMKAALSTPLSRTVERWGGIADLRQRQSKGAPNDVSIAVRVDLKGEDVVYGFKIGSKINTESETQWVVKEEVLNSASGRLDFRRTQRTFKSAFTKLLAPSVEPDSLMLPLVAGADRTLNSIWRAIRSIETFNVSPEAIRAEPLVGGLSRLERDGRNTGDVLKALQSNPELKEWLLSNLKLITPGLISFSADQLSGRRIIKFQQRGRTDGEVFDFTGRHMSDGTLRALALLVALVNAPYPALVVVDEIDDSLHPHAIGVLIDALASRTDYSQVLISTHDVEVLSFPKISGSTIRVVDWQDGVSRVFRLKKKVIESISSYETVGDLLRTNTLFPENEPLVNGDDFWRLS